MYNIEALNAIVTNLGGTGVYKYEIDAYNFWAGDVYKYEIDALNAIDVAAGGSGGHKYTINALNSIDVALGGSGGHSYTVPALVSIGSNVNQIPSEIKDGTTVIYIDYLETKTITKNELNRVSEIKDALGGSNKFIQPIGDYQIKLSDDAFETDNSGQHIHMSASLNQPTEIYLIISLPELVSSAGYVFGGSPLSSHDLYTTDGSRYNLRAGVVFNTVQVSSLAPKGVFIACRFTFNGSNSFAKFNEFEVTGNAGNLGTTLFTLFSANGGPSNIAAKIKACIIRSRTTPDTEDTANIILDFLKRKHNIT